MTGQRLVHVAIADDWEACKRFGEYEVSTRGISYDAGFIRATKPDALPSVLDLVFGDLTLPLIVAVIDEDALTAAGIDVEWEAGKPRILRPLPMDEDTVVAELAVERFDGAWPIPDLTPYANHAG
jgi:uncharacterized protein (DUF952 family)